MKRKKIAIVGTGISGLGAAFLLHPHHDITVYEKNSYIGGHTRCVEVTLGDTTTPVDTGFIVFNKRNYPLLTRLFEYLDVPIFESAMSFGASIDGGSLEYGTEQWTGLFAQKRNLFRPRFWGMLYDILKFNQKAGTYLFRDPSFTLGDCLDELAMGAWFRDYFLLAMGSAIWSTPIDDMMRFPASTFIRFFENHGLLTLNDHPQWYTVKGGSGEYVRRLIQSFSSSIHTNRGVKKVWRRDGRCVVEDGYGDQTLYDDVVLACHADQALEMIGDITEDEKKILSAFSYQPNRAVLHSDITFMPKNRGAWASWVYLWERKARGGPSLSLSYWMNNLQPLNTPHPLIVTLNPGRDPDPRFVHNDYVFDHPVFDAQSIQAQDKIKEIQGKNHVWFCGAYQRYGFHEDGLNSAVTMAQRMGVGVPW